MQKKLLYQRFKLVAHIIFWATSFLLLSLIFQFYGEAYSFSLFEKTAIINAFFAAAVYINLYILIPFYLKKKKYIFYVFWLIILLSTVSISLQVIFIYPLKQLTSQSSNYHFFNPNLHSAYFFTSLLYVAFTTFIKLSKDWLSLQDINLKLVLIEQQKLEAELKTLKGQLNPHFLFNSLNNIYSLALTKSDQVPVLILKLADLMRHIIYDSKDNFISLEKELEFVRNFIDLQKIRISESNLIQFEIHGQPPVAKIAPLIFEPFIDNAFKHGLPSSEKRDFIKILFDFTTEKILHFEISNNFEEHFIMKTTNSGIGLTNVKQRLKLLYTNDEYSLTIQNENKIFHVTLILKLK